MDVRGKRILVVGASSGLGRALALRLARAGARLSVFARRRGSLESLAGSIREAGGEVRVLVGDTSRPEDVRDAWQVLEEAGELPEGLVFMAGVSHVTRLDLPLVAEARANLDVNFFGFLHWLDLVLPRMRAAGSGLVMAASALCAYRGVPSGEVYAAGKAALANLMESLALDLAPEGIRVHLVLPGFVDTPMSRLNNFTQPFMIDAVRAADLILADLGAGRFRTELGPGMSLLMRMLRALPDSWYQRVFAGFVAGRLATERFLAAAPPLVCREHGDRLEFDRYATFRCPRPDCEESVRFPRDRLDVLDARGGPRPEDERLTAAYRLYALTYPVTAFLAMKLVWEGSLRRLVAFYRSRIEEAASAGGVCLEVAIGDGSLTRLAMRGATRTGRFLGVDLSFDMLRRAASAFPPKDDHLFMLADAARLPLPPGSFPRILCFGGVHVFRDPGAVLGSLARLLAPGGVISGSILARPGTPAQVRWAERFIAWGTLSNSLPEPDLESLFARAGLRFEHREWNGRMLLFTARAEARD